MEVKNTYKYINLRGFIAYACGFTPQEYNRILEVIEVLYPQEGYLLQNKYTNETYTAITLSNDITESDFIEVENPNYQEVE